MSSKEMPVEQARKVLGDLVIAAMHGKTTVLTRYGKPVAQIAPYQEPAMTITVTALAAELNASKDDVLALADQLVGIDGSEAVVASEEGGVVTLTAEAADTIREQIRGEASESEA